MTNCVSSGTTGSKKILRHSTATLHSHVASWNAMWRTGGPAVLLLLLPGLASAQKIEVDRENGNKHLVTTEAAAREPGRLRMFNLSVLITDAFIRVGTLGTKTIGGQELGVRAPGQHGSPSRPAGGPRCPRVTA